MNKELLKIISDRRSGSSELLEKLAALFLKNIGSIEKIRELLKESEGKFQSFAAISAYINQVKKFISGNNHEKLFSVISKPLEKSIYKSIYQNAFPFIKSGRTIFTFSNSKTIFEILKLHNNQISKRLKVFITESRPANEAKVLADELLKEEIKIEFGVDAVMSSFIALADMVFCGADKILKDSSIINKTGSLNAAVLAAYYKKPFYVFAQGSKITSSEALNENSPAEVWKKQDKNLKVHNNYFEKVPAKLITRIFTEKN